MDSLYMTYNNTPEKLIKNSNQINNPNISNRKERKLFIIAENFEPTYQLEDLAHSFQYVLTIGRVLGIIPLIGFLHGRVESIKYRWKSYAVVLNACITIALAVSTCVGIIRFYKNNTGNLKQLEDNLGFVFFYGTGFFIYTYFLLYSRDFIQLLYKWRSARLYFACEDENLRKDVHVIAITILVSITLEHTTWHLKQFADDAEKGRINMLREIEITGLNGTLYSPGVEVSSNIFRTWYKIITYDWADVLPYDPLVVIFGTVCNKFGLYAWNFADILIIIISRAMYGKFKVLNELAEKSLFEYGEYDNILRWKHLMIDHLTLTELLTSIDEFFSAIIFISYAANIYDLSMHINNFLSSASNTTFIGSVYVLWSFVHLTMRLFMVSYTAAKIHEYALKVSKILKKCPIELYNKEIKKFETELFQSNVGLSAFGAFTITKPFMLQILNVVFTVEIVLLQQNK